MTTELLEYNLDASFRDVQAANEKKERDAGRREGRGKDGFSIFQHKLTQSSDMLLQTVLGTIKLATVPRKHVLIDSL